MRGKKKFGKQIMVMALTMIMAVVSLPAGLGSALEPGTAQAAAADNWASDVAEFESYGNKGWTETGIDVPKWSGNNAASNKDTGDPKTDAFVKPKPGSAETVRYKAINVAADSTLTLPVEETAEVQYYEIYFPEQLRWAITNQKSFRLMNDLDMNGRESRTWSTANLSNKVFMDGNGHTIYNLNTTDGGLIGTWTQPIIAKEIKVVSARMQSGLFTGASRGSSTYISMEGVRLEHALIQSGGFGGGLIGAFYYRPSGSYGRVYASNCHTKNVYVNGSGCSGNIFGPISGFVENCYAIDGTVRTNTHSGAFTSCAGNYIIKDCFTNVRAYANSTTGAFVGHPEDSYYAPPYRERSHTSQFINCFSSGRIEGGSVLGGFVAGTGSAVNSETHNYIFENCYSTAMVGMQNAASAQGGFIGQIESPTTNASFINCFSAGEVGTLTTTTEGFNNIIGGFIGQKSNVNAEFNRCYYDKQTSAMRERAVGTVNTTFDGITGLTTKDMADTASQINGDVCSPSEGLYPQLKAFTEADGFTSEEDKLTAKAYSAASVTTAFMRDNTTAENPIDYDTVREITELFPLSNDAMAKGSSFKINWTARDIKSDIVKDTQVLTVGRTNALNTPNDDQVTNMAPGIGWADVEVPYAEGGKTVIGRRSLRIVPTSVLSLSGGQGSLDAGKDTYLYPNIAGKNTYDHRPGVSLVYATAAQLATGVQINPINYPLNDTTYSPDVTVSGKNGNVKVEIFRENPDGTLSEDLLRTGTTEQQQHYKDLFAGGTFTAEDKGTYTIKYTWTIETGNTAQLTNSKRVIVRDPLTVQFKWNDGIHDDTAESYAVRPEGGSAVQMLVGETLKGKNMEMPADPDRTGYTFEGWSVDKTASTADFTDETALPNVETLNVYALWQPKNYAVKFNSMENGKEITLPDGSAMAEKNVADIPYGTAIAQKGAAVFPVDLTPGETCTVDGAARRFMGWSTLNPYKDGKQLVFEGNFTEDTVITHGDKTAEDNPLKDFDFDNSSTIDVYPVFAYDTGSCEFYDNKNTALDKPGDGGALISGAGGTVNFGAALTRPADPLWDNSHVFLGWSEEPLKLFTPQGPAEGEFTDDFTAGTTYDGQEPVLKYYAVWRDNTYTVNAYVKGSGTPEDTLSQTGIYGEKIALPDMTDDQYYTDGSGQKYHFTGWINREYTTEAVTAETVYHVGDTSVGDDNILDLQAQYEKVYDVTFHRAAGENSETFRTVENIPAGQTIGGQFPTDSPAPPEGKVFIGWTLAPDAETADTSVNADYAVTANTHVYPVFREAAGTLAFKMNDGTDDDFGERTTVSYGGQYTRPQSDPAREGFEFMGWSQNAKSPLDFEQDFEDALLKGTEKIYEGFEKEITYYAVWRYVPLTVRFYANINSGEIPYQEVHAVKYQQTLGEINQYPQEPARSGYRFMGWSTDKAVNNFDKDTKITEKETDVYALWSANAYKAAFDANGGSFGAGQTVQNIEQTTDQPYKTPGASPARDGYVFAGWYVDSGDQSGEPYDFSQNFTAAKDQTFYAKWSSGEDTPYTVEHYQQNLDVSSYTLAETENLAGTTGAEVTASPKTYTGFNCKGDENGKQPVKGIITGDNTHLVLRLYYDRVSAAIRFDMNGHGEQLAPITLPYGGRLTPPQNPTASGYVFKGWKPVSADGSLEDGFYTFPDTMPASDVSLKAVWSRLFEITASKYGRGSITGGTGSFEEGAATTVAWKPDDGYAVSKVMVDGQIRDDLLNGGAAGSVVFENIAADHQVYVTFEKAEGSPVPGENAFYTVYTKKTGGSDGCLLSPTRTFPGDKESSCAVEWKAAENYHVTQVIVDGVSYPTSDEGSIPFTGIQSDHYVEVIYEKNISIGGSTTPGFYTITTNHIGGDPSENGKTFLTPSSVVKPGSDHIVSWSALAPYSVERIIIDQGTDHERILTTEEMADGSFDFNQTDADHVVDVVFKKAESGTQPDPAEKIQIITSLVGGPGEITSSAVVEKGSDYKVEWKLPDEIAEPDGEYYNYYVVDKVLVNDEEHSKDMSVEEFNAIEEDQVVKVILKPNLYNIQTAVAGKGSISPSATLFYGQDYEVNAHPDEGWYLWKVKVDGATIHEYKDPDVQQTASVKNPFSAQVVYAAEKNEIDTSIVGDQVVVPVSGITTDHEVKVIYAKKGEAPPSEEQMYTVTGRVEGGPGTVSGTGMFDAGEGTTVQWTGIPDGYEVKKVTVTVNGVERPDLAPSVSEGSLALEDIHDHYDVIVTIGMKGNNNAGSSDPEIPEESETHYAIETAVRNGEGEITPSIVGIAPGSQKHIEWKIDSSRYEVQEVRIDGNLVDSLKEATAYDFTDIQANHRIEVILKEKGRNPDVIPGGDDQYTISTLRNAGGVISPTVTVDKGADHQVTWKADEGCRVARVIVDGVERPDLVDKDRAGFNDIQMSHQVEVIFEKDGEGGGQKQEHTIATTIGGGSGSIDSTAAVPDGQSHTVHWHPGEGQEVGTVIVDGVVRDDLRDKDSITFDNVTEDHQITVIYTPAQSGGETQKDFYVIGTSIEGQGSITPTASLEKGSSHTVAWKPEKGWKAVRVEIDGVVQPQLTQKGEITFDDIGKDHTVNVIFEKEDGMVPSPDEQVQITTGIKGGLGTISSSMTIEKGEDAAVRWTPAEGYVVEMVWVNGEERPDLIGKNGMDFKQVEKSQDIRVSFKKADPPSDESAVTPGYPDGDGQGNHDSGQHNGGAVNNEPASMFEKTTQVTMSSIAPVTGIRDRAAQENSWQPLLQKLFGLKDSASALSLLDLFATSGVIVLTLASFLFKKQVRGYGVIASLTAVILFFATQPLILKFTFFDKWSPLFLILLLMEALMVMMLGEKKEKEDKTQ
ncbi:InlB B-repeat-containing protein [Eubacterium callanderi]|uniref:InlB B-repeat-containing protein n=1 Tax=Eubacterium callanderi TaxID=53442 RepID=UPI001D15D135|nr:InlB B-repeat-containing protein [Eubacterium callanderi]MCC3400348.1 hypothetical protein [Eubacterium callanderi]